MPEGHTLHRLAGALRPALVGEQVRASSPQGRFADGAARLDGRVVTGVEAYGKHLFYDVEGVADRLHVHLGLYGKVTDGVQPAPEPRGALRLRVETGERWFDLRGPTACEWLTPPEVTRLLARLGPDPLRRDADPGRVWQRLRSSRAPIATALMDQSVVAGIGNVYRAELLFRHGRDPYAMSRTLGEEDFAAMWSDLVTLMRAGVRSGRIVTTRPEDRDRRSGRATRADAHYVYRRTGLPCRLCGTPVSTAELAGRNLYWCRVDQVR